MPTCPRSAEGGGWWWWWWWCRDSKVHPAECSWLDIDMPRRRGSIFISLRRGLRRSHPGLGGGKHGLLHLHHFIHSHVVALGPCPERVGLGPLTLSMSGGGGRGDAVLGNRCHRSAPPPPRTRSSPQTRAPGTRTAATSVITSARAGHATPRQRHHIWQLQSAADEGEYVAPAAKC